MNRKLMRPSAALFPLALLVAAAAGRGALVGRLALIFYGLQFFTLCAADCFRNGAARETGVRRADRRFTGGLAQLALGCALFGAVFLYFRREAALAGLWSVGLIAAAGCIALEQLIEERMYALGRRVDGATLSLIANLLLAGGMLLDEAGGVEMALPHVPDCPFTLGAAALGALIALITAYAVEPPHGFSLVPRNLPLFPRACAQTLLYPALALWIVAVLPENARGMYVRLEALLYGLLIWRLSRTLCRRSDEESRPLNLILVLLSAIPAAIGLICSDFQPFGMQMLPFAAAAALATLCAGAVFCAFAWRFWLGFALVLTADALLPGQMLPGVWNAAAGCGCCLLAVVLNLHKVFLRRVKRAEPNFD